MPEDKRSVTIDISKWKMRDRMQFTALANDDEQAVIDFLIEKGVITAWSFEGSPSDKEAWLNLELEDFSLIVSEVSDAMVTRFRRGVQGGVPQH